MAVFNVIKVTKSGGRDFLLRYLHPEYSLVDYRFDNVDLLNLDEIKIIATPLDSKNKRKNQERYVRIAFESLDEFSKKKNRKNYFLIEEDSEEIQPVIVAIQNGKFREADMLLKNLIRGVSKKILEKETDERQNGYGEIESDYMIAAEP